MILPHSPLICLHSGLESARGMVRRETFRDLVAIRMNPVNLPVLAPPPPVLLLLRLIKYSWSISAISPSFYSWLLSVFFPSFPLKHSIHGKCSVKLVILSHRVFHIIINIGPTVSSRPVLHLHLEEWFPWVPAISGLWVCFWPTYLIPAHEAEHLSWVAGLHLHIDTRLALTS